MKDTKYVNVDIGEEFHTKVKIAAVKEGVTMTEYVNEALRSYLDKSPEKEPQELTNKDKKETPKTTTNGGKVSDLTPKLRKATESYFNPQPKKGKK